MAAPATPPASPFPCLLSPLARLDVRPLYLCEWLLKCFALSAAAISISQCSISLALSLSLSVSLSPSHFCCPSSPVAAFCLDKLPRPWLRRRRHSKVIFLFARPPPCAASYTPYTLYPDALPPCAPFVDIFKSCQIVNDVKVATVASRQAKDEGKQGCGECGRDRKRRGRGAASKGKSLVNENNLQLENYLK